MFLRLPSALLLFFSLPLSGLAQTPASRQAYMDSLQDKLLDQVVVTGTRTDRRQLDSPVAVAVMDGKLFAATQSNNLAEGLCFMPGLRMETDCQSCNYSQLRMNGLGGAYSQVLINSRPVFSSLMSLYGLEQIPANMIERVEVVRGGGSVLYGANAIAGTVNVITKQPKESSFTLSNNTALIGGTAPENTLNANVTMANKAGTSALSLFASNRFRQGFDANGDGFTELSELKGNAFGFNGRLQLSERDVLDVNGWSIYEDRRGGNRLDERPDQADQSEYRKHNILLGGVNYAHRFANSRKNLQVYFSGQHTLRDHYTGIDQIDGWGNTRNYTLQGGFQYNYTPTSFLGGTNYLTVGAETQYEYTFDQIKAYNYLIDQQVNLLGAFAQSDWEIDPHFTLLTGLRLNKHSNVDKAVLTPRLSLLYKPTTRWQLRGSYARGFKAPQALEADMHIAFSGGGVSVIQIDPDLKQESSDSFNFSVDYNRPGEHMIYGFTLDAFYTRLYDTFVLQEVGQTPEGNQILRRSNGGDSYVAGVTAEARLNYDGKLQLESGFTLQRARYEEAIFWSEELPGERDYLRTPQAYGYYTLTFLPEGRFNAVLSGVLTGPMKVPHFGGAPGVERDELVKSPTFLETNIKLAYTFRLKRLGQDLQLNAGVQNVFNQYQDDFDLGKNRDSNYVYGPGRPRTFFMGVKFGLM